MSRIKINEFYANEKKINFGVIVFVQGLQPVSHPNDDHVMFLRVSLDPLPSISILFALLCL